MTTKKDSPRESARYSLDVPMTIELSNGFFHRPDRVDASLVDLSHGGAAIVLATDYRLKRKGRYRAWIGDHAGIIEVGNLTSLDEDQTRLGVSFTKLGLELQELVADTLDAAKQRASRITDDRDPFAAAR